MEMSQLPLPGWQGGPGPLIQLHFAGSSVLPGGGGDGVRRSNCIARSPLGSDMICIMASVAELLN